MHRFLQPWGLALLALSGAVASTSYSQAATPEAQKVLAVGNASQTFSTTTTRRAIQFYDVTNLSSGPAFDQQPLFSVWLGYEISAQSNFEELSSITTNPVNGNVYVTAYDSGPQGVLDPVGDTQGDLDLYRIDYQEILNDFKTNNRPLGTMYAPTIGADGASKIPHPDYPGNTQFISGAIQKVGQVARTQGTPFFDAPTAFINPAQIAYVDNEEGSAAVDTLANDHQLRIFQRVDTVDGKATTFGTNEGGYNGASSQSWVSHNAAKLDMDNGTGRSEPVEGRGMALVQRDGVTGVWVADRDGGGDDVAFFKFDLVNHTATKQELRIGSGPYPTAFATDEHPASNTTTNDGEIDWLAVDANGNLLIGESGYYDTGTVPGGQNGNGGAAGAAEPRVLQLDISSYNGSDSNSNGVNEIVAGAWHESKYMPVPTGDDDTDVTNGQYAILDKSTGRVIYMDPDSAGSGVVPDVFVFDPATGTFTYQEQDAVNAFVLGQDNQLIVRGDATNDDRVNAADIDKFFAVKADPTIGGTVSNAVGQEWYDLTGEGSLTTTDVDQLVRGILNTQYGDANLDGRVSAADLNALGANYGKAGGWAKGDFNGSGGISAADLNILGQYYGFNNSPAPSVAAVPEPGSLALLASGAGIALAYGLRRRQQRRVLSTVE